MKLKKALVLLISLVTLPAASYARDLGEIYRECGIGGLIFSGTGWAAVTSNIVWDWGTTATSSDITTPESCKGGAGSAALFIHESYSFLAEETAKGEGEHLQALLSIVGCQGEARSEMITGMRQGFAAQANTPAYLGLTPVDRSQGFFNLMVEQAAAHPAAGCKIS